ncbi:uncharacterized protein LOC119459503 isoform X2 [Dermacentor silvarum]|uniref:uncharacterized protein LOC119459503 isoform X2 n=1 Tax=Dermacentor silvarum TaxID=543639 RepID=UPI0021019A66|nr:uncharacterized protein LOC119459503 isoform X2 [Dermacentor silvarum]
MHCNIFSSSVNSLLMITSPLPMQTKRTVLSCFLVLTFLPAVLSGYVKGNNGRISLPTECYPHCVEGLKGACFINASNQCQCHCVPHNCNACAIVREKYRCSGNEIHLCNIRNQLCECGCVPPGLW